MTGSDAPQPPSPQCGPELVREVKDRDIPNWVRACFPPKLDLAALFTQARTHVYLLFGPDGDNPYVVQLARVVREELGPLPGLGPGIDHLITLLHLVPNYLAIPARYPWIIEALRRLLVAGRYDAFAKLPARRGPPPTGKNLLTLRVFEAYRNTAFSEAQARELAAKVGELKRNADGTYRLERHQIAGLLEDDPGFPAHSADDVFQAICRARHRAHARTTFAGYSSDFPSPQRWPVAGELPVPVPDPARSPLAQRAAFRAQTWRDILALLDPVYEISDRDEVCTYAELTLRCLSSRRRQSPSPRHAIWLHDAGDCLQIRTYATDGDPVAQAHDTAEEHVVPTTVFFEPFLISSTDTNDA